MYTLHFCKLIENNIYDERLEKIKMKDFINEYSLENKGDTCEYWINNLEIIKNKNSESFNYINDNDIKIMKNGNIIREYITTECIPFLFSNVDCRDEYVLYVGLKDDLKILLKEFSDHITIEFISSNIDILNNISKLNK